MKIRRVTPNFDKSTAHLIGQRAVFRTYDRKVLVGTIERFDGTRAIIRFSDGRWGYSDHRLELVVDA